MLLIENVAADYLKQKRAGVAETVEWENHQEMIAGTQDSPNSQASGFQTLNVKVRQKVAEIVIDLVTGCLLER